jgi:hypothetical protein
VRLTVSFGLKKGIRIEIMKMRKVGNILTEEGIKYSVEQGMGAIKIQISITK